MKKCECECGKVRFTDKLRESSVAVWLFAICGFLLGIIVGFAYSPIKKGIDVDVDNSCRNIYTDASSDEEEYEDSCD